jgi:hypothetical protein
MKLSISFISWEHILLFLISLAWLIREVLFYQKITLLTTELHMMKSDKDTLIFRLSIDESSRYFCDGNNGTFSSTYLPENIQKLHILNLQTVPVLYDWFGLIVTAGICSLISLENYFLHEIDREDVSDEVTYKQILLKVNEFVLKRHPILTLIIFILMTMLSPFAWFGIFNRSTFVNCTFKMVLSFCNASLLFFVVHNFRRLTRYFPRDTDEWRSSLLDWNWWLWVLSRLLGVYDLATGTATALWMGSLLWFVWPFRYFFYFSATTCSSGAVSAISSGAMHAQELATREAVSVFLVNMVGHSSLLAACCFLLYLLVIVPPLPANRGALHSNFVMRLWSVVQRKSENSTFVAVISLVSVCNSLLALLRVTWFVFLTSPCGFYASCVAWMFVHAHIGMSVWVLPVVNALMQRSAVIQAHREQFVMHFRDESIKTSSSGLTTSVNERDAEATGTELFDNVLILSLLFFVFVQPYEQHHSETGVGKGGQEQEEVKLVDVFQGLLRAEMLAHAAQDPFPVDETSSPRCEEQSDSS